MGKVKSAKINYAIPGNPLGQQKFEQMIRKAEKGPFYTVKEVKTEMAKWKEKYPIGNWGEGFKLNKYKYYDYTDYRNSR